MAHDADTIISQLIQIVKFVSQQSNISFEERTTTFLQFHTLSFLEKQPDAKLSDVAKHLNASLSSTTQLIERMHKSGFVNRTGDENDRRIIRLAVTNEGLEKLKQMKETKRTRMQKLLSGLDKKEIKELVRIQDKLIKNLHTFTVIICLHSQI